MIWGISGHFGQENGLKLASNQHPMPFSGASDWPQNGLKWAPNGPQMAPNGPHQHCVFIVSPNMHDMGYLRPLWPRKRAESGLKSAPDSLQMASEWPQTGPKWPLEAPKGPHRHCMFVFCPTAHDWGHFRPFQARKRVRIGSKTGPIGPNPEARVGAHRN